MKLYQIVQKNFALLGISPNQSRCNQKSVFIFFILSLAITLGAVFIFFKANTFLEYTQNIYITITFFGMYISFLAILFQKGELFELIDYMEKNADESEYQIKKKS